MPTISVVNTKGGTSKTTTAINLGAAAAYAGSRPVIVDADPQGSASAWIYAAQHVAGEGDVPCDLTAGNTQTFSRLPHDRVCIVDTGPGNPAIVDAAVSAADMVVIPTKTTLTDLDRLWETLKLVQGVAAAVLLTQVNLQAILYRQIRQALEEDGVLVFPTPIVHRERVAQEFGQWPRPGRFLLGYDDVYADIMRGLAS